MYRIMPIQERYEPVIRQFARRAQEQYPAHIAKIILFGSVARGEDRADSDIDLLVLWNGDENEGWHAMTGLAFDLLVKTGEYLSVKVMQAEAFTQASPFVRNVTKEGITVA
jgi:predicted nucleotidyltransferase|nr:nucleotidyltransferase domain-containing protein [uncultured Methanoregula sp.]